MESGVARSGELAFTNYEGSIFFAKNDPDHLLEGELHRELAHVSLGLDAFVEAHSGLRVRLVVEELS